MDDCRYAVTLQERIAQARAQGRDAAAQRAERVLRPLLDPDAPGIESPLTFSRYRWRIAREILALRQDRKDRELALPFAAVADNPPESIILGSNLVVNASFEERPHADGTPPGRFNLGYPKPNEKPAGTLLVTDETAHSGRFCLKWDLSKVADPKSAGRDPRWVTVNVGFDDETVRRLQGKRVKVGYWVKLGGGQTVPGLGLRQNLKEGPGEGFYYRGGIADPAGWNHFEAEGRLSPELQSMDIHTWCTVPEATLARNSFFYMDDVSLEVIEEPPLSMWTALDEYYAGEEVHWRLNAAREIGLVKVQLVSGKRIVSEMPGDPVSGKLQGQFRTETLSPGLYTLRVLDTSKKAGSAQKQFILAPDPFDFKERGRR